MGQFVCLPICPIDTNYLRTCQLGTKKKCFAENQTALSLLCKIFCGPLLQFNRKWTTFAFRELGTFYFLPFRPRAVSREKVSLFQSIYHFSLGAMHFGAEQLYTVCSNRILHFFWSFLMMVLISSYTANLAAVFSENTFEKPIQVHYK